MKKIIICLMLGIFLISLVSASDQLSTLGVLKQNDCIQLRQTCGSCTYVNFTKVSSPPSGSVVLEEVEAEQNGVSWNYTFCNTSELGVYYVEGFGDIDGTDEIFVYDFKITPSGREASIAESILYFIFIMVMFFLLVLMIYFIFSLPSDNEKDDNDGRMIKIIRLKYVRIIFIAITYPIIMIILNLINGLAINFTSLSIFAGTFGFLFETMLRLAWIFTVIIILWIFYLLIKDTNVQKQIKKIGRMRI